MTYKTRILLFLNTLLIISSIYFYVQYTRVQKLYIHTAVEKQLHWVYGDRLGYTIVFDPKYPTHFYYSLGGDSTAKIDSTIFQGNIKSIDESGVEFGDTVILHKDSKKELKVLGFDDEKLVFWLKDPMDSPGPCTYPWIDRAEYLSYVIPSKDNTIYPYTPSTTVKNKQEKEKSTCVVD